jgi:adenylosuccinate lyase
MSSDHETYRSPFSWRYGSPEMRALWSEVHKRRLMRRVWVALAEAQQWAGLVTAEQVEDLKRNQDRVDIKRSLEIEGQIHHDVMAEIRVFAGQCPIGGKIIHWGATSADITDNVDVLRMREGLGFLAQGLAELLQLMGERISQTADLVVMAFTHLQPAEPTTLGYRLSVYAQDLLLDLDGINHLRKELRGKGFKGAVGSQASFQSLLEGTDVAPAELEARAMQALDLPYYAVAAQTYTRQQDLRLVNALAGLASSLHKFALDFRFMQSPAVGEWSEPFASRQVGSSAMPFKRNPILSENICSLARYVAAMPAIAWDNASQAILERTLDDSANRRVFLPETFLAVDEMLVKARRLVSGMEIDETAVAENLARYGPFAATEQVLMALVAAGADRQAAHEWIRQASLVAWTATKSGQANPLAGLLAADERLLAFLPAETIRQLMDAGAHTGTAAARARAMAATIQGELARA